MTTVTRHIEVDYGHRLANHESACSRLHGHRAKIAVSVVAPVRADDGTSSEGMVFDFKELKSEMMKNIHDLLDHRFIVAFDDPLAVVLTSERAVADAKTVIAMGCPVVLVDANIGLLLFKRSPTAENLAELCWELMHDALSRSVMVTQVELWETSNSSVVFVPNADAA
jgi:6-pyruvoyl tetrahydropterin synthase/QueD family protein